MVEPVTIGNCTLYLGDCLEVLWPAGRSLGFGDVADGSEAIVTDPPYGMGYDTNSQRFSGNNLQGHPPRGKGRSDRAIVGDGEPFDPEPWLAFNRVVLWGANHFAHRLPVGTSLIWLKRSPDHYGTFLSDAEIAWARGGHGVYVFYAEDSNARRRMEATGSAFGGSTAHPTQKPIALMEWCIQRHASAKTGDQEHPVVLDPFMGSGTTGVACAKLGRKFIGVEIEPRYFDIAVRRIEDAYKQPDMFIEQPKKAVQESLI